MRIGTSLSIGLVGLKACPIAIQSFISPGLPYFSIIGLPDTSVSEARERVKSACSSVGFSWPETRITVNLSPASIPKKGSSYDLAIALSILSAGSFIPPEAVEDELAIGELNLDGSVLHVNGVLPMILHAKARGIRKVFVPYTNEAEASIVPNMEITGVRHLSELVEMRGGKAIYRVQNQPRTTPFGSERVLAGESRDSSNTSDSATLPDHSSHDYTKLDMSQVLGQEQAKWALTVAAAGGHHMIMTGPPGSGKSMLASRLPTILPPLSEDEQLEVASIRSLCGNLHQFGITDIPPFVAPHHTASTASLVGGGSGIALPGAITRAHRGVLFMDEAPEFSPRTLQTLREPLETGLIALSRAKGTAFFPARFQLIMAANPCPCGFDFGNGERCTCSVKERTRYWNRLSGPILDRIDIQSQICEVSEMIELPSSTVSSSETIRNVVLTARNCAKERFHSFGWNCNADASGEWLRKHTSKRALSVVNTVLGKGGLSMRGADRSIRLCWTLADLNGHTSPNMSDIESSIQLRTRLS
ncbi:MAG: YifB family Mg chelatase-like AAA ATPase [Bifidobacterium aquikefiri]|uniref:YifB family Mg chelatase-like AAA ATPase n=1 Tax=Bifidobacterium aquikefiri TaxID=1653207 RepID=UPI0039EA3763